jgi:hypothetical protein
VSTDAIRTEEHDAPTTQQDAPTAEVITAPVSDRCAKCQAPLAPDQRYCVNCGERRGQARFSPETYLVQIAPAAAEPPAPTKRPRFSSGTTLVAGVATLLIALGVGVLIGHDSSSPAPARQAQQIITVPAAGSTANTTANTPTTTPTHANGAKSKAAKATVVHVTAKTAQKATQAASKVLGSGGNISHNATQSVGGSCSGGAGCQNGRFTGNFFGGN